MMTAEGLQAERSRGTILASAKYNLGGVRA